MPRSAWDVMTGQGGGHVGRWTTPVRRYGGRANREYLEVPKPEKRERPERPQPTKLKGYDELMAEFRRDR